MCAAGRADCGYGNGNYAAARSANQACDNAAASDRGGEGFDQAQARANCFPHAEPDAYAYAGSNSQPNYAANASARAIACS